jgi:GABA(A) receptor-associated protein
MSFKSENSFQKRKEDASKILIKYPDRVPIICEKALGSDVPEIDKKKYLVPKDITIGQFIHIIRQRIKLSQEQALFIFVNNVIPATSSSMSSVYESHKDDDGFLYIVYASENTFG